MNRSSQKLSVILLTVFLLAGSVSAQPPTPRLEFSINRTTITVGDPIEVSLDVVADSAWAIDPGEPTAKIGPFFVLHDTSFVLGVGKDKFRWARHLRLTVFEPGSVTLPPISIAYNDSVSGDAGLLKSDSIKVEVTSVLAQAGDDTLDIRDIKRPYRVRSSLGTLGWLAVAELTTALTLVILVLAGKLGFRRRYDAERIPPPWEVALADLEAMRKEVNPVDQDGRNWYYRLSYILRRFLDGRLKWETLDKTTSEIAGVLRDSPFEERSRRDVLSLLQRADGVKYARRPESGERALRDWEWVQQLVMWASPHSDNGRSRPAGTQTPQPMEVEE